MERPTEFKPVTWKKDKEIKSFHGGSKDTPLGRAYANIFKHSGSREWTLTVMKWEQSGPELFHQEVCDTLRDAKEWGEFFLNRAVCMMSLDGFLMYDEGYDYRDQ